MGYEGSPDEAFAAQLAKAIAAGQRTGQRQMAVRVLKWANEPENKFKLHTVRLVESLLEVIDEKHS